MNDRIRITHTVDFKGHTRRVVIDWPAGVSITESLTQFVRQLDDVGLPMGHMTAADFDDESRGAHVLRVS